MSVSISRDLATDLASSDEGGGGPSFDPAYWSGYCDGNIPLSSATWVDLFTGWGAVTESLAQGITRSGSSFTFDAAGVYSLNAVICSVSGAAETGVIAYRARSGGVTLAQQGSAVNFQVAWHPVAFTALLTLAAGAIVTLQRVVANSANPGTWVVSTLDGEATRNANIAFYRVA